MKTFIETLKKAFFEDTGTAKTGSFLRQCFFALLFLVLFGLWSNFLELNITYSAADWQKEYDYYSILKQAVSEGVTPYHITREYQTTDRFLAIPEIDFSPQIIFLKWLDVRQFMYINIVFLFTLGFFGLLLLRKKLKLLLINHQFK